MATKKLTDRFRLETSRHRCAIVDSETGQTLASILGMRRGRRYIQERSVLFYRTSGVTDDHGHGRIDTVPSRSRDDAIAHAVTVLGKARRITALNDQARKHFTCRLVATAGVEALGSDKVRALLKLVKEYDAFDPAGQADGNDPHGEHDFGTIRFEGEDYFWKIDYYADTSYSAGAEDPADPRTQRVLTIMLASEY
jgi:hypothetical protein